MRYYSMNFVIFQGRGAIVRKLFKKPRRPFSTKIFVEKNMLIKARNPCIVKLFAA